MATTNFVHLWRDGERLFVDVNGATIEAHALTFDAPLVTLQFQANVVRLPSRRSDAPGASPDDGRRGTLIDAHSDPLLDECLW
jgi:hypothetical protein